MSNKPLLHFAVRDRATQGIDFLVWDIQAENETVESIMERALVSLYSALEDDCDVELIITKCENAQENAQ